MKVLWLCNFMLPAVARMLGKPASNKEGWISGMADTLLMRQAENKIELAIAFPVPYSMNGLCEELELKKGVKVLCLGFYEDTRHPEKYDKRLEKRLKRILEKTRPDLVHCFGTEYPHTLALCRAFPYPKRILLGIQGLCSEIAKTYYANLPQVVYEKVTFRDYLRGDSMVDQKTKFEKRGQNEIEAIKLAGHVTGRTAWDRECVAKINPDASYHEMNETLRPEFYGGQWSLENCARHTIFMSQGDYPVKGLHYMLIAFTRILDEFPDARLYVAGNSPVGKGKLLDRVKVSGYGYYVGGLLKYWKLREKVIFLGSLSAEEMKRQYLSCHAYVCCSTVENSPNSLGEAMMLGVPCAAAEVGGIPSLFTGGQDGMGFTGYRKELNDTGVSSIIADNIAESVMALWSNTEKCKFFCNNARNHAQRTHDPEINYSKLQEIYKNIVEAAE